MYSLDLDLTRPSAFNLRILWDRRKIRLIHSRQANHHHHFDLELFSLLRYRLSIPHRNHASLQITLQSLQTSPPLILYRILISRSRACHGTNTMPTTSRKCALSGPRDLPGICSRCVSMPNEPRESTMVRVFLNEFSRDNYILRRLMSLLRLRDRRMRNCTFGVDCFRVSNGDSIMLSLGVCLLVVFNRRDKWLCMVMWSSMERS